VGGGFEQLARFTLSAVAVVALTAGHNTGLGVAPEAMAALSRAHHFGKLVIGQFDVAYGIVGRITEALAVAGIFPGADNGRDIQG
jgi:hypothetical protein